MTERNCLVCGKKLFQGTEKPFRHSAVCTGCQSGYWLDDDDAIAGYAPRKRLGYLHYPEGCLLVLNWESA